MNDFIELNNDKTLPYGTSWENILKLLEAIKKKQGDEKGIKAVYTGAKIDATRKAMETLGLVKGFNFEKMGKELAFEINEEKKKEIFLKVILNYQPYELFLSRLSEEDFVRETDIEEVKSFWGKHDFGASQNNRNEAANVFGSFIQLSGLGEFITGRRGKTTRIKWNPDAKKLIDETIKILDASSTQEQQIEHPQLNDLSKEETQKVVKAIENQIKEPLIDNQSSNLMQSNGHSLKISPNITINVDMTDWEIDKIQAFFKAAYGEFDNGKDVENI
ncbi:hypothetical protein P9H28_21500 [Paenibacillus barengoltzii]|uniref:hypothetical protein n=1 Tax=Paenibacillus barengoltzii TaxID=343517 RepID=UPI002DBBEF93|nr:hypothetical protein [Paenibacillus barengoltzii]MEC2346654.1 hypothetical protein [Paenibacillus barengoltzii]